MFICLYCIPNYLNFQPPVKLHCILFSISEEVLVALTTMSQTWHWISPAVRTVTWGEAACSALGAFMCTLGQPGNCSMQLDGFGWILSAEVFSGEPCAFAIWVWIKLESKSTIFTHISCMLWRHSVIMLQGRPQQEDIKKLGMRQLFLQDLQINSVNLKVGVSFLVPRVYVQANSIY